MSLPKGGEGASDCVSDVLVCSVVVDCVLYVYMGGAITMEIHQSLTNGNTLQLATPYKVKHC